MKSEVRLAGRKRALPLLLAILAAMLFLRVDGYAVTLISEESELAMGKGADKEITAQYGIYPEKSLQLYVNQIGQKLVSFLSDKIFYKYFFTVVDSPEINAFALPGGYIYVTRGILAFLNNEAELATVMGHEVGHVIFHHAAQQIVRAIGSQILSVGGAIANPKNASQWLMVSSQLFQQINLGYGQEAELESDAHGIVNSYEAGYNPAHMVNFLRTLRMQEVLSGQSYHSFQATHPDTRERIVKAEMMSSSMLLKGQSELKVNRESYLRQIRGMAYGGKKHRHDKKQYPPEYVDIYEVAAGDTFASIAAKELNDKTQAQVIATLNGMRVEDKLKPGELLKLVKQGTPPGGQILKLQPDTPLP